MEPRLYTVSPADGGKRVGDILQKRWGYSVRLQRRLKQLPGAVLLNGVPARMVDRAPEGALLAVYLPADGRAPEEGFPEKVPEEGPPPGGVPILYEDGDVLVYNKPPFLAMHPCRDHQKNTLAEVFFRDMARRGVPGAVFRPVYRLDRDTDGICVVAKNPLAAANLAGHIQKTYTAVACGLLEPDAGTIDAPIAQLLPHQMRRGVREDGQRAVTHYEVLARGHGRTLLRVRLETGRTHQIRVHFAYIGHPLVGDSLYGGASGSPLGRQALSCTQAAFVSPGTGRPCEICINMQDELANLMQNE